MGFRVAYKVEIPDGSWHSSDDLTGNELEAIESATATPWSILNPFREIGAYRAIVTAFAIRTGMGDADIVDWFNNRTNRQLEAGLKLDEGDDMPGSFEDGIPKVVADERSTSSSASSPDHLSDGPPT